jgi:hypothetical protein
MADRYSEQVQPAFTHGSQYRSGLGEVNSVKRVDFFSRNTTDAVNGDVAQNDVILAARIPANALILGGVLLTEALGTNVTATVGRRGLTTGTASAAAFLGSTNVSAISRTAFAQTKALGFGYRTTEETYLTVTLGGAVPAGNKVIEGFVEYVVN